MSLHACIHTNIHMHTHMPAHMCVRAMERKKRSVKKEKGFQGRFESIHRDNMVDRNRELVPGSWNVVRENALTTGHSLCVFRRVELLGKHVNVKKIWFNSHQWGLLFPPSHGFCVCVCVCVCECFSFLFSNFHHQFGSEIERKTAVSISMFHVSL